MCRIGKNYLRTSVVKTFNVQTCITSYVHSSVNDHNYVMNVSKVYVHIYISRRACSMTCMALIPLSLFRRVSPACTLKQSFLSHFFRYIANFVLLQFEVLQNHAFSCTKHPLLLKSSIKAAIAMPILCHYTGVNLPLKSKQVK